MSVEHLEPSMSLGQVPRPFNACEVKANGSTEQGMADDSISTLPTTGSQGGGTGGTVKCVRQARLLAAVWEKIYRGKRKEIKKENK